MTLGSIKKQIRDYFERHGCFYGYIYNGLIMVRAPIFALSPHIDFDKFLWKFRGNMEEILEVGLFFFISDHYEYIRIYQKYIRKMVWDNQVPSSLLIKIYEFMNHNE